MNGQSVTLYCRVGNAWHRTVLCGVACVPAMAENRSAGQAKYTNRASLLVPCAVGTGYVPPAEYAGAEGTWTLRCADFFTPGECAHETPQAAAAAGCVVYFITTVSEKRFRSPLAHWEVGGGHMLRRGGGISG